MKQTCTKGLQDNARLGGKSDPLKIKQKIKLDNSNKWYKHITRIRPKQ